MNEIDQALGHLDVVTATTARPAIESLIGVEETRVPLTTLTQSDVQHFLWRALPSKWLTDDHEHHEIAWALGDFFEAAGLERYAEICRDPRTHRIMAAWHESPEQGVAAAFAAEQDSGLVPPDTDVLSFGEVMGGDEARVYADVCRLLEGAIIRGELDPSARGFRARSRKLVADHLTSPSLEYDGRSPVAVVHGERIGIWLVPLEHGQRQLWQSVVPQVLAADPAPPGMELSLAPAAAVLEAVGEGVTLTSSGYLPAKLAIALDDRFRWSEEMIGSAPRGESDVPTLMFLDDHLRDKRLLTRRGRKLTVSAEGRRCLADPARFWSVLTGVSTRQKGFEADALAVMAAVLLAGEPVTREQLDEQVASVLAGKWRAPDGVAVSADDVYWIGVDWYRRGRALGWWSEGRRLRLELSRIGRAAAANLFRSVATQPLTRPGVG